MLCKPLRYISKYATANVIALQTVAVNPIPNSSHTVLYPYPTIPAIPVPEENAVIQALPCVPSCFISFPVLSSRSFSSQLSSRVYSSVKIFSPSFCCDISVERDNPSDTSKYESESEMAVRTILSNFPASASKEASPKLHEKLTKETPNSSNAKPKLWAPAIVGSRLSVAPSPSCGISSRTNPPQPTKKHASPIVILAINIRVLYDTK
mmetsp:Transcript_5444/g.13633  ORF Transcript_5444/g.13633 Transcript_5444/m.13633 type:complete len:208 (-) Transcript_5444:299-922(-)